jgi:hypothetical protein
MRVAWACTPASGGPLEVHAGQAYKLEPRDWEYHAWELHAGELHGGQVAFLGLLAEQLQHRLSQ